jgi:hypothetical protein
MNAIPTPAPWYRQPWPWILMSGPAVVVVASLFSAYLAVRGADPVIEEDYYRRGLEINAELARLQNAAALGLHAELAYGGVAHGDWVRVRIESTPLIADTALRVRLIDPTHSGDFRSAVLGRIPGSAPAEFAGQWLDAPSAADASARTTWRVVLQGRDWQSESDTAALRPR